MQALGEPIHIIAATLLAVVGFIVAGSRGFHLFYRALSTYHKLPSEYDPVAELKNIDELENDDRNPEDYVNPHDFTEEPSEDYCFTSDEIEGLDHNPEIVVDFAIMKKFRRGESWETKFIEVWFYNSVAVFFSSLLFVGYLQLTVDFLPPENVAVEVIVVALVLMISTVHLALRLTSFVDLKMMKDWPARDFCDDVFDFAFSFNLSTLLSFLILYFMFMTIQDASGGPILNSSDALMLIGTTVVFSFIASLCGEIVVLLSETPDSVKSHRLDPNEIG
ncbi:hypothetical protein [Halorhabdus sp. SVX81]|uniref:hypothetical protein n=1 Tax=Halorhabdus sp. SVX81 TaxID=2978283 RepID=UPI0023DB2448|nr:hypothetical protein [Halorhabdus sp. SVX81]